MRAGIYYRVSSEEQVDGFSLDAQRRILLDFCQTKGWAVAGEYADEGKSARGDNIEKRPQFKALLEDAESRALDVVVVHKLDRFSRNMRVTFDALARLDRCGVAFTTVVEHQFDFTTPMGKVMLSLLAAFAQYYSDNLSHETRKGKTERKAQGLWNGHIPFGMVKGPDGIPVADPATIEGLQLAFQLAAEGRSDREIAQALNERGYRTSGHRTGKAEPFSKDTVSAMLQSRFYLGELPGARRGETVPGQHAPIIDRATFAAAHEQRERRAFVGRSTVRRDATPYSLSGLGVCVRCGGRMQAQPNKGRPRLFCASKRQTGGCTARSTFLSRYEEQIGYYLERFTIPANYRDRLRLFVSEETKHAHIATAVQRRRLERQLERSKDLYRLGDIERAEYLAERERVQRDLAALAAQQTEEQDELAALAELLCNLKSAWGTATQEQRNRLARMVFEEVRIEDERVVAVKPRPELAGFFALDCQVRGNHVALAEVTGFEPAVSALTGQRVRPLHHTSTQGE